MKMVKEYGGLCEPAMSYTISPVHSEQYFVDLALKLEDMGADVICIKDMANLLLPMAAYSLVEKLKKRVKVPIHLHTHNTTGTGDMVYLMATLAGVDIVDTALSPMGNGTAQPATEPLVATLKGHERDTGLDLEKLSDAAAHFRGVADKLTAQGFLDPKVMKVDTNTLTYQVPGGMLSNLISQLKEAKKEDKYYEVLAETAVVRKEFGYPPLVTPTSQIVGTQAVMNVIAGERYKMVTKESKALLRGEYGQLPGEVDPAVRKKVIGDDEVITVRPADLLKPEYDKLKEEIGDLARSEEDVLSYAVFPQVARAFFEKRLEKESGISDELLAVITAAVSAYGMKTVHPLIRNVSDPTNVSAGLPAINPLIRNR
jgi:oxaloacetate decarboxylase alpha subunit